MVNTRACNRAAGDVPASPAADPAAAPPNTEPWPRGITAEELQGMDVSSASLPQLLCEYPTRLLLHGGDGFPHSPAPRHSPPSPPGGLRLPLRARWQPCLLPISPSPHPPAAMWAEGVAALPKSQSNRSGVKSRITAASRERAGKKSCKGGTRCLCQNRLTSSNTEKRAGMGEYHPLPQWFISPLFQGLGVGNVSSAGISQREAGRGLQLWQNRAPGPESRWSVEAPVRSRGSSLRICAPSSPLAVPAQAVPSTPRHTAVTQPGAALSKQMLKRRSCSDLKRSCQSFGPTDVSPVHRGPCTLHRQSKRLKTRLNQNIEINICLLGGMLGLAH